MAVMECSLCSRPVEAKRVMGIGTLLLVFLTGGLWIIAIFFYKCRCPICRTDALTSIATPASSSRYKVSPVLLAFGALVLITSLASRDPVPLRPMAPMSAGLSSGITGARGVVLNEVEGGKFRISASDLKVTDNPWGQGEFVFGAIQSPEYGIRKPLLWVVVDGTVVPMNGPSYHTTPNLRWPRELPEFLWSQTGLNVTSTTKIFDYLDDSGLLTR